jgi:hypothetical protein
MYKSILRKSRTATAKVAFNKNKTLFNGKLRPKFTEVTTAVLHLEHSFLWCCKLGTSEGRSEIPGKFRNVVLERDGGHCDHRVRNEEVLHRVKEDRN